MVIIEILERVASVSRERYFIGTLSASKAAKWLKKHGFVFVYYDIKNNPVYRKIGEEEAPIRIMINNKPEEAVHGMDATIYKVHRPSTFGFRPIKIKIN